MKKTLFILLFIPSIFCHAQDEEKFLQTIVYTVELRNDIMEKLEDHGWNNCLVPSEYDAFFTKLYEQARDGEIAIYQPYKNDVPPNEFELVELSGIKREMCFMHFDTLSAKDPFGDTHLMEIHTTVYDPVGDYIGLQFTEDWYLDPVSLEVSKVVRGVDFIGEFRDVNKNRRVSKEMFHIPFSVQIQDLSAYDHLIKQDYYTRTPVRVDDEFVETRWWLNHLQSSNRYDLTERMLQRTRSGAKQVYELPNYGLPTQVLQQEDAFTRALDVDTNEIRDPFGIIIYNQGGVPLISFDTTFYNYSSIQEYVFLEDWYFDFENLSMYKEVKGMIPVYIQLEEEEQHYQRKELFFYPYSNFQVAAKPGSVHSVPEIENRFNFDTSYMSNVDDNWKAVFNWRHIPLQKNLIHEYLTNMYDGLNPENDNLSIALWWSLPDGEPLNQKFINELWWKVDTLIMMDALGNLIYDANGNPIIEIDTTHLGPDNIGGLRFHEEWVVDLDKLTFEKTVHEVVFESISQYMGEVRGFNTKFQAIVPVAKSSKMMKPEFLISEDVQHISYIRSPLISWFYENDFGYHFSRYYDWTTEHIEPPIRVPLVEELIVKVKSGEITAYYAWDSLEVLSGDELIHQLCSVTSDTIRDPFGYFIYGPDGNPLVQRDTSWVGGAETERFIFHEDWYANPETFSWHKDVKGITIDYIFEEPSDTVYTVMEEVTKYCEECDGARMNEWGDTCPVCNGTGDALEADMQEVEYHEAIMDRRFTSFYIRFNE